MGKKKLHKSPLKSPPHPSASGSRFRISTPSIC
ncbi:BnaC07g20910D [Brassica napus]|uniref:BnaC07g20910D protein n=1 Tax=Brassica napus TaxID=3708 RepID=A0A078HEL8_BRANA|nr:BnaC07g20910D [Brassica napus]